MSWGEEVMGGERYNIFRFNSGKQGKTMPDYNPYTIKQGCEVVVLDLDMHPKFFSKLPTIKLSSSINNRYMNFRTGVIKKCYVIYHNKAILIDSSFFSNDIIVSKERIKNELEKIRGD